MLRHANGRRNPESWPRRGLFLRRPLPGLVLARDWTRTRMPCTLEGAVKSGWLAAETVLEDLGWPERLAIEAHMYDGLAGMVRRGAAGRPKGVP
ncbi:MAG: 15-cis-phytoene desaturase [Massilia sp.]|jgi:15-cis-phytoene desaturase